MRDRVFTVVYMVAITAIATALMTGAKVLLQDRIALNEKLQKHRAELHGLGLLALSEKADARRVDDLYRQRVREKKVDSRAFLLGFSEDGKSLQSIGMEFIGQGNWGPIRGLIAFNPTGSEVVGITILQHQETPGLGGRITEREFLSKFIGRPVPVPDDKGNVPFWQQTDAITGATRTSDSMARILNRAVKDFRESTKDVRDWE